MQPIVLTGVSERDVDLLIVEEIISSASFLSWLLTAVGLDPTGSLVDIRHSVGTTSGESDIEIDIHYPSGKARLLLENKIYAPFQPQQAERYSKRAVSYRLQDPDLQILTILVAPDDYGGGRDSLEGFSKRLSYESILDWFMHAQQLGDRATYKCSLLSSALERGGTGWTMIPNDTTTAFWQGYWNICKSYAKELNMPKPGTKPATSSFIFFQPSGLRSDAKLVHKLPDGKVDLQFAGMGPQIDVLERTYRDHLEPEMSIEKAAKSASIRIRVPEIDLQAPLFLDQVHAGLDAALKLLHFYREHV